MLLEREVWPMRFVVLALVLAAVAPVRAEEARVYRAFTLPWGTAAGAAARVTTDTAREYAGPSALRVGASGDLLVVDPVLHRVQRFAPSGQLLGGVSFPESTAHDAQTAGVDAAEDRSRELYVLELAERVLLRFGANGAARAPVPVPVKEGDSSLLTAVGVDEADRLMVFDGFDNRVLRFGRDGKPGEALAHDLVQGLTPDGAGRFLSVQFSSPTSASSFQVWRVEPVSGAKEGSAPVQLARPANELNLLGQDRERRVYVEVAYGGPETRADREVLVLSPEARIVSRFAVPPPPVEFRMLSARAVLPQGGVVTASASPAGLVITPHLLESTPAPSGQ